jgi:hypothetical protein
MRCVANQIAAVNKGRHFHARGQDAVIQLFNLGMNAAQSLVRICAFAQQHNP